MRTDLFDFDLPDDRIALEPASPRDAARLLVVRPPPPQTAPESPSPWRGGVRGGGQQHTPEQASAPHPNPLPIEEWGEGTRLDDRIVRDLPDLLRPGDALVFNDTRVIRAALHGERLRGENRARIAFNLHKRVDESRWRAFARPAKRLAVGDRIRFGNEGRVCLLGNLDATVTAIGEAGEVELSFSLHGAYLDEAIAALGDPPLPPYIAGKRAVAPEDAERYQTVYARHDGAVAAPTAGLHFTPALLAALDARGISRHFVTLHVGAGTFLPVKADDTAEHRMHAEWGEVSADDRRGPQRRARRRRPHRCGRHHVAAAAGDGSRRRWHDPAVRRRDRALHHARLPLQGRGPADDQLPPAALDAVHAGRGLQRPRHHAGRLRARHLGPAIASIPTATPACSIRRRRP